MIFEVWWLGFANPLCHEYDCIPFVNFFVKEMLELVNNREIVKRLSAINFHSCILMWKGIVWIYMYCKNMINWVSVYHGFSEKGLRRKVNAQRSRSILYFWLGWCWYDMDEYIFPLRQMRRIILEYHLTVWCWVVYKEFEANETIW